MKIKCVKITLIWFLVDLMTLLCRVSCSRQVRKSSPEHKTHLALPTVSCSVRGIRAVFGPLVKENLHVTGKTAPHTLIQARVLWGKSNDWIILTLRGLDKFHA